VIECLLGFLFWWGFFCVCLIPTEIEVWLKELGVEFQGVNTAAQELK